MFINTDTLHSLQIIETESHPNSQNQGPRSSGAKEGLSVYGVFHCLARTSQGRQRLRQWFLRPTTDTSTIQQRQRSISIFVRPENVVPVQELTKNLKDMGHIRSQIIKLRKGVTLNLPINSASTKSIWSIIRSVGFSDLLLELY
jgi:DNA mismatch repair protein MSH5